MIPSGFKQGPLTETYFAACQYFATELWEFSERIAAVTSPKRFELLIPLSGHGQIEWSSESAAYGPAEIWLLPAALGAYQLSPQTETKMLRTYVPDLQEFAQRLADQRVEESVWSRLVHP